MKKYSIKIVLPILLILAIAWPTEPVLAGAVAKTWKELTTPPEDTVEAANRRIWVPVERKNRCRVTIDIFDQKGEKIRTLFDALLGEGYFNFWWDKRDDSLHLVEPGIYDYKVVDLCAKERTGTVIAAYREWERRCRMEVLENKYPRGVILELLEDSAIVSARVLKFNGGPADVPFVDSLMNRGIHRLEWNPPPSVLPGRYKMMVTVGDYSETFIVRFAR